MTGTNDKIRSLILVTLMVLSLFAGTLAFAGTASADIGSTASVSATHVSVDEPLTKQKLSVTVNASSSPENATLTFDNIGSNAAITGVKVNTPSGVSVNSTSISGNNVTLAGVTGPSSAETIFVTVTWDTTDKSAMSSPSVALSDNSSDISGVNASFSFLDTDAVDAFASGGQTFWKGQGVYFEGSQSTTYQVREVDSKDTGNDDVGTLVTEFQTNSDGVKVINTGASSIDTGQEYVITNSNQEVVNLTALGAVDSSAGTTTDVSPGQSWEVQTQTLDAEWDDDEVSNEGGDDATMTEVDIDSNRGSYDLTVSANGLDVGDLEDIFEMSGQTVIATDDDDETITIADVSGDDTLDADFADIDQDDYEFSFMGGDTNAEATANISVTESEGNVNLGSGTLTEERGDVANITANLENTDTAYIQIGTNDTAYNVTVEMQDGGDGQVGLEFNTFLAALENANGSWTNAQADQPLGNEDRVFSLTDDSDDDDDSIENIWVHTTSLDEPLDAGSYDIAVSNDAAEAPDTPTGDSDAMWVENEDDVKTLDLQERSTQGVQLWTAPRDADYDDQEELLTQVNQTNRIAENDLLVIQLQASGIYGQIDEDEPGQLYNESNGFMLTVEDTPGANQESTKLDMGSGPVQDVFADDENNSLYVVVDTGENGMDTDGNNWNWESDEDYVASWELNSDNGIIEEDDDTAGQEKETAEKRWTLTDEDADFDQLNDDDMLEIPANENAEVSGSTSLAPGSEITIRIRGSDSGSSFLKTVDTTVNGDRMFSAMVDMSDRDVGDNFTAVVRKGGSDISDEYDGVVVEQVETETETSTPEESTSTSTPTEQPTTTPGETSEMTSTTTAESGSSGGSSGDSGGSTTKTTTPGFGVLVALIALIAAALLAVRREN